MKYIKIIIMVFISLMLFNLNVKAEDSEFEPTINIEFTSDEANIMLGYKGEILNDVTNTIAFDSRYFTYEGISPLEDFRVRDFNEDEDGRWKIITVSVTSDASFYEDTNYLVVTLKLKSNFKSGMVYLYNYLGISAADTYKYRHNGYNLKIKKQKGELVYFKYDNTKNTKTMYYLKEYAIYVALFIFALLLIFIIYLIIPSKVKKENKKEKLNKKIYTSNNKIIGEKAHEDIEELNENDFKNNPVSNTEVKHINKITPDNEEGLIRISTVDFGEDKNEEEEDNN